MKRRTFIAMTSMATLARGQGDGQKLIPSAQIGVEHAHAAGKMQAMRKLPELYRVIGITETDDGRWAKSGKDSAYEGLRRLSLDELLASEAEVVAIETHIDDAPSMAMRCLEAGKHLHVDKPAAIRHSDFRKFRQLAEEKKLQLQMGYMLRYNPAFELLIRAVKDGWLGEITGIDASMGKLAPAAARRELSFYEGGGMFELACHLTDMIVHLLGKPDDVKAFSTPVIDDGFKDNQLAVLSYPKATATIRCNHTDPFGGPQRRFAVTGTKGSFEIVPLESGKVMLSLDAERAPYRKGRQELALDVPKGRYDAEFVDLAAAVRGEKALAWDAAHDIAVHETVLRSAGMKID